MNILVNGNQADTVMLGRLQAALGKADNPPETASDIVTAVLSLKNAANEAGFDLRYLQLLHAVNCVDRVDLRRPSRKHGLGAQLLYPLRKTLWYLLRPAVDKQVWRQNAVNRAVTNALEFMQRDRAETLVNACRDDVPAPEAQPCAARTPLSEECRKPPAIPVLQSMNIQRAEQWLAGCSIGDAVSRDAVSIKNALKTLGIPCDLLAPPNAIDPAARSFCSPLPDSSRFQDDGATLRIMHYSIGSPMTQAFLKTPRPRIMRYHNITPACFFDGFDDRLADRLREGRAELRHIAGNVDAVWADSGFNAAEIEACANAPVTVLPLMLPLDQDVKARRRKHPSSKLQRQPFVNILFVGRVAPNKNIEELMLAFDRYYRRFNPRSRLLIIGSERSCPRYYALLRMLAAALDNAGICFEGHVTEDRLDAWYGAADLFVSTSAHEGYGAPLVEAMAHGVPVVARRAGGMPEAMDGAGILFDQASPAELAALMQTVAENKAIRDAVVAAQNQRIHRLYGRNPADELKHLIKTLD